MNAKKKLFHSRPLFYAFLSLMFAVATSKFIFDGNLHYILFDVVVLLVFLVYCLWAKSYKTLIWVLAVFAFGLGWYFVGVSAFQGKTFSETVHVIGRISDDVKHSNYGGSATVILKNVEIDGQKEKNISLVIKYEDANAFAVGDMISFEAKIENVQLFTLGKFNSSFYRDRTPYKCEVNASDLVVQGNRLRIDERFRLKIKEVLNENMGSRSGAVAYAVLFGDKNELDSEIYETYKSAGIVHLLTVSGLHISFLIALLGWILKKCRIKGIWNFLICALFLGAYAYLCNFTPSVLRAGIMGMVLFSTSVCGKCYDGLSSLGFAGILIVLFNPLSALDLGFLMSFFCVLAIFTVSPWLKKLFAKVLPKKVAGAATLPFAVQVGILPFLAQMDGGFINLLTFFVNLIVLPIFSLLFPVLFLGTLLTAGLPFMGFLLKGCGWGFGLIESIAKFFGETKLILNLEALDVFVVAAFFVGIVLLSKLFMTSRKIRLVCATTAFVASAVLFGLSFIQLPVQSSVSYGFNNSYSVVVMTNKKGESIIVDMAHEGFTKSFLKSLEVKKIATALVLQKPSIMTQTADEIGVENIVRSDEGQGYDNEVLLSFGEFGSSGEFSFVYRAFKNRLIGLEIYFDETSVFILKDWKTSIEAIESLPERNFDFVILGKNDAFAPYFNADAEVLTYYNCSSASSSFQKNGNISYLIDGKNYKRRCLD